MGPVLEEESPVDKYSYLGIFWLIINKQEMDCLINYKTLWIQIL